MMRADHQGAARDMLASATQCWQRAAVETLLDLMGPDGPRREQDHGGMVEQVSGWHQAKAGASGGLIILPITPQMATSSSGGGRGCSPAPRR